MKIFYHDDADGKAAAHCVYLYAKLFMRDISKEDFFPVNYGDKLPDAEKLKKGETVFIVDYSFTEKTIGTLSAISFKALGNVYWYDHHKSSLDVKEYVDNTRMCKSVVIDMNRSGAKIAYDELITPSNIFNLNLEKVITYVDDYDRWIHKYPESLSFNSGLIMYPNGPTDDVWEDDPAEVIEKGAVIQKYLTKTNNKIAKNSFFIKINDKRCIVLNTPSRSSQSFGSLYERYKFGITYSFNGKEYYYSVYSSLPDIDCSLIAKHFDPTGGGHKGAAGFRSNKELFKNGNIFRIRMGTKEYKKEK